MDCIHCNAQNSLIHDVHNAQLVCTECGYVAEESMIDDSPEWIFGSDDNRKSKDPSRCGAPVSEFFEKSSMSTKIGGQGNVFMKRLHNQMSMDYVERARFQVFNQIENWARENGQLPQNVVHVAKDYYVKMNNQKISRGNVRKGLIACCIMYACKQCNVSRSVKEISAITGVEVSTINRAEKKFEIIMSKIVPTNNHKTTDVSDLITRFVNCANIATKEFHVVKNIQVLYEHLKDEPELIGKTPHAITAGLVCYHLQTIKMKFDKKQLAQTFDISNVTLNKIVSQLNDIILRKNDGNDE